MLDVGDAIDLQLLHEPLVERDGDFRPGGGDERRAVPLLRVGEQGELGNDQGAVPAVEHGEVHLLVVVFEDPEVRDLLREEVRFCFRIVLVDAEQDEKSAVDRPEGLPFYDDAGGGDPLDDSFH